MDLNVGWIISAIGLMGGFLAWFVKVTINGALTDFREEIRKEFKGEFLDRTMAAGYVKDLEHMEKRVNVVEDYAHDRFHALNNQMMQVRIKLGLLNVPDEGERSK